MRILAALGSAACWATGPRAVVVTVADHSMAYLASMLLDHAADAAGVWGDPAMITEQADGALLTW